MIQGKIREFSITTSLGENQAYLEGSMVEGNVVIDLRKPKVITRPIRIVLSGKAQVRWAGARRGVYVNGRWIYSNLRGDVQTIFEDMTVNLWGTGSERLAAGKHQLPYAFQLPANIPSSHKDLFGQIAYTLTATMPTSKREITEHKVIYVDGVVVCDTPELMEPVSGSGEKTIAGGSCCFTTPIVLSGKIDKGGYACGDKISVRANHGYRRITNVQAFLRRKVTYHCRGTGETNYNYKNIADFNFTTPDQERNSERTGYLTIPNTVISTSCEVLKVSYAIIVKLLIKLPNVQPLAVELPITIGNGRTSPRDGSASAYSSHFSAPVYPVMPSAPLCPFSGALQDDNRNIQTEPQVMPSAPLRPLSVTLQPASSVDDIAVPDSPPPPYQEC